MDKLFIISRYNEDYNWIKDYTDQYIIYNKGESTYNNKHIVNTKNIGGNQRDLVQYIYENYENLPELMVFVQANPWDHCKKEIFDKLIQNNYFTPIEYYGSTPANAWEQRSEDGGFVECNNSWYIQAHNSTYNQSCKYLSFDEFMNKYFLNYEHLDWIRFAPGSQYIVEKKQALFYPKDFWYNLMNELNKFNSTEAHIVERALWLIFQCNLQLKENYE